MFCGNCGKQIKDESKFCPFCGVQTTGDGVYNTAVDTAADAGTYEAPLMENQDLGAAEETGEAVLGKKKHRGKGLLLVVLVAVIAVTTAGALAMGGLFVSPKGKVLKAAAKSMSAYAAVVEKMDLPDLGALLESKKLSESMSVRLKSLPGGEYEDFSMLEGLGMEFSAGINLPDEEMQMMGTVSYGSVNAASFRVSADGSILTAYSPEFFDETAYGVDTATLGKDLRSWGVEEDISFRIFDLLDTYSQRPEMNQEAAEALAKAVTVEKIGEGDVEINGNSVSGTEYQVVVPEDALLEYLAVLEDTIDAMDYDGKTIELLRSMGVPDDEISYMEKEIEDAMSGSMVFRAVREVIRELGDVELTLYLKDGYVMAALWDEQVNGTALGIHASFGGGKNYADDFSVTVDVDEESLTVESSGNHVPRDGTYTDTTTLRYRGYGQESAYTMDCAYTPKETENNFSWELSGRDMGIEAEGQMTTRKDSLELQMDDLSIRAYGSELCALELGYTLAPYAAEKPLAEKTVMLGDMSYSDMEELALEIEDNAEYWLMNLMEEIPELQDAIWYFM